MLRAPESAFVAKADLSRRDLLRGGAALASGFLIGIDGSVDQPKALAVPGVREVVVFEDLVAVIGDNTWAAMQGF
jgi:isoquinoline 1-oxidoreductase beta subunit